MSQIQVRGLRRSIAALLLIAVVTLQSFPVALAFAEEAAPPPETAAADSAAPAADTPAEAAPEVSSESSPETLPQATTDSAPAEETVQNPPDETATSGESGAASSVSEDPATSASESSPDSADTAASDTASSTDEAQSASSIATSQTDETPAQSSGSGAPAQSESSSEETTSSQSSTEHSSAATTSLDLTSTGSSTAETHDDTAINATSSGAAFSINGILDEINDIASSTGAGLVPSTGGGGTPVGTATTTDESNEIAVENGSTTPEERILPEIASSTPAIISGDAIAIANILNILNTTFLNSQGAILFQNFMDEAGTVDFRNPMLFLGLCGQVSCSESTGVQLNLLQDGHIDNDIVVSANAGENLLTSSSTGAIVTGNAYAGLNLVNLANVTIANSNYLLVALNAFRGIHGDLIFPSLLDFFTPLANPDGGASAIGLANDATVGNDISAGANSGDNTVMTGAQGTSTLKSGTADAQANVFNQINALLAGSGLSVLIRLSGDWTGEVQGLPSGVSWLRTPEGILIQGARESEQTGAATTVSGTSTADISNRASVGALTGANMLDASTSALMSTGNAFAGANVINVANQTVIGRNWILAVINIFGDFTGNISFGKPDLWVGDRVVAPGMINVSDKLTYTISVLNNGDAPATNATLRERWDAAHLRIVSATAAYSEEGGDLVWNLGTLAPGAGAEITYVAEVTQFAPTDAITSHSRALLHESDNNPADNEDTTTVRTIVQGGGGGGGGATSVPSLSALPPAASSSPASLPAVVTLVRSTPTVSLDDVTPTATEVVVVSNDSASPAYGVVLHDLVLDESGAVIHDEPWDIGIMAPREQVTITYDISFASAQPGSYRLISELSGDNIASQSVQNGTITYSKNTYELPTLEALPALDVPQSSAGARAALPKIPNTAGWVEPETHATTSESTVREALTAAVGNTGETGNAYVDLVTFALLILASLGALRFYVMRF